jgi:MFS family permease
MSERITAARSAIRRIAIARAISYTGGAAAFMALNFEIFRITHSAGWLAATLFLTFGVVGLAGPLAGLIGDRFDRRRVMIVSDLGSAALCAGMAFVHAPVWLLSLAFLTAVAEAPFRAASSAAVPNLIEDQSLLGWANGLLALGLNAGVLLGPVVGGVLVAAFGAQAAFMANAVSFVLSAGLVASVHSRFRAEAAVGEEDANHRGMSAGFRVLLGDRYLRTISLAWVAIVMGGSVCMVADVPLADLFGAGAAGYGAMIAGWGAGSILGSVAGRWVTERREPAVLVAGATATALGTAAVAISPVFWPVVVAILVAGFGDAYMSVAEQGMFQRRTADAVRARVMAAFDALIQVSMAASFGFAGLIVALVGPRGAYVVGGVTALVAVGLLVPMRRWSAEESLAVTNVVKLPDDSGVTVALAEAGDAPLEFEATPRAASL